MSVTTLLRRAALIAAALVLGLAVFAWWKLQPHSDPQALPAALVSLQTDDGQRLLESADARADYAPLEDAFEPQSLASFCGVASSVTVLNAMGQHLSQETFFNQDTNVVRSRLRVIFGGMSLPELAALLEAHGADVTVHHADTSTPDAFRAAVETNLNRPNDFILVNYQREALGQGRVGHISPLAAYDRDTDKVLILDTASHKYPPTWAPLNLVFDAMNTVDTASGKTRGFLEVAHPSDPRKR